MIDRTSTDIKTHQLTEEGEMFLYTDVLPILSNTTLRLNFNRKNSGTGRSQCFGYGVKRKYDNYNKDKQHGLFGPYYNNHYYPDLWRALVKFGTFICPQHIPFTAIQVNYNYECQPHLDNQNIGRSITMSFGNFSGGKLVINGVEYDTDMKPLEFNGALCEHYVTPISGQRYSFVYFVSIPNEKNKNWTDSQIHELHEKIKTECNV